MIKVSLKFGLGLNAEDKKTREIIKQILKECFWDYDLIEEDLLEIVKVGDFKKKMFLFQKILSNSTNILKALRIFTRDDLKELFEKYTIPTFKHEFLKKRKGIAESIFFDKENDIYSLSWRYE